MSATAGLRITRKAIAENATQRPLPAMFAAVAALYYGDDVAGPCDFVVRLLFVVLFLFHFVWNGFKR